MPTGNHHGPNLSRGAAMTHKCLRFNGLLIGGLLALAYLAPGPARAADSIKIGLVTDLTGMAYLLAKDNGECAKTAIDETNRPDGVRRRPFELLVRDSRLRTEHGSRTARRQRLTQRLPLL